MTKVSPRSHLLPKLFTAMAAIGVATWIILTNQLPTKEAIKINEVTPTGMVTLSFGSASAPLLQNTISTLPITINTGAAYVTTSSVVITYDPALVAITAVSQGSFLTNVLVSAKLSSGQATFTYAVPGAAGSAKQGTGIIATLSLKPLTTSAFTLTFGTGTLVAALDSAGHVIAGNVLRTADPVPLTPLQPVNGGWSDWSTKDTSCGITGTQTRTCTNPTPANGGADCTGASTQPYTNSPCSIPGDFNTDGHVNIYDYNALVAGYGHPYTIFDYNDLVANYGK